MWDLLLMVLLLQQVFVPYWTGIKIFDVFVFFLIAITAVVRGIKIQKSRILVGVGLAYFSLTALQGVLWGFSLVSAINSFSLLFLQTYLLLLLYKGAFFHHLERAFFLLASLSFLFWLGVNSSEAINALHSSLATSIAGPSDDTYERSILVFTHWSQIEDEAFGLSRFSGFFHEPGALAFFSIFMIIFRYTRIGKIDRRTFLYMIFVVASFSSAGYAALGILGVGIILNLRYNYLKYFMILPIFIGMSYAYSEIEFLQDKIEGQVTQQTEMDLDEQTVGRVIGIRKAFYVMSKYPLYGRGLLAMTQPKLRSDPEYVKYGWTSFVSKIGLLGGVFYLYFFIRGLIRLIKSSGKVNNLFTLMAIFAIFVNLTAQAFIESIPMVLIFYYGLIKNNKYGR